MTSLHFEFDLDALEDVAPWGTGEAPSLSWFGLTSGRYRIHVGETSLLEYAPAALATWHAGQPEPWESRVDYYVARPWEDLLDLVPHALQPVPAALAPVAALHEADWQAWRSRLDDLDDDAPDLAAADSLGRWRDAHHLDTGYLNDAPCLSWWNLGGEMLVRWESERPVHGEASVWSAGDGETRVPRDAFRTAVVAFDTAFLAAMAERVDRIVAEGLPQDGVAVDLPLLDREQRARSAWLAERLAPDGDVHARALEDEARRAVAHLGERLPFAR